MSVWGPTIIGVLTIVKYYWPKAGKKEGASFLHKLKGALVPLEWSLSLYPSQGGWNTIYPRRWCWRIEECADVDAFVNFFVVVYRYEFLFFFFFKLSFFKFRKSIRNNSTFFLLCRRVVLDSLYTSFTHLISQYILIEIWHSENKSTFLTLWPLSSKALSYFWFSRYCVLLNLKWILVHFGPF